MKITTLILVLCLLLLVGQARGQCDGITVVQQGPIVVLDHAADYNCGVFELQHTVTLTGATLAVTEFARADAQMDCICPYRSHLEVAGLEPGDYVLSWTYGEEMPDGEPVVWSVCEMAFVVSDPTGGGELAVSVTAEGCGLTLTGVPGDPQPEPLHSWSTVKARFR